VEASEWYFRLIGDEYDLRTLFELFGDCFTFTPIDGAWVLSMQLPFSSLQAGNAQAAAEALVAHLNAGAHVAYGNHENIRLGAMACRDRLDGPVTQIISGVSSIRSHVRVGGGKLLSDRLRAAAPKDRHFDRALYLFGVLPQDWRGLYMVLEAAEDGNGDEAGLKSKRWISASDFKNFKSTANSFKAIGNQSRHGTLSSGVGQPLLTLEEARTLIRTILERWANELA
jgi:hypothetical protein